MIEATNLSRTIWIVVASLLVVFALFAAYKIFIEQHDTVQSQACQDMRTSRDLSFDEAICTGTRR